jgi:hypothetical protein
VRRAKSLTINELRLWNIASPVPTYPRKKIKKVKKKVAIFQIRDILFSVMRDNVTCEEVFEMESDAWVADVTVANGFDDVEAEADDRCWCKFFESCAECA